MDLRRSIQLRHSLQKTGETEAPQLSNPSFFILTAIFTRVSLLIFTITWGGLLTCSSAITILTGCCRIKSSSPGVRVTVRIRIILLTRELDVRFRAWRVVECNHHSRNSSSRQSTNGFLFAVNSLYYYKLLAYVYVIPHLIVNCQYSSRR